MASAGTGRGPPADLGQQDRHVQHRRDRHRPARPAGPAPAARPGRAPSTHGLSPPHGHCPRLRRPRSSTSAAAASTACWDSRAGEVHSAHLFPGQAEHPLGRPGTAGSGWCRRRCSGTWSAGTRAPRRPRRRRWPRRPGRTASARPRPPPGGAPRPISLRTAACWPGCAPPSSPGWPAGPAATRPGRRPPAPPTCSATAGSPCQARLPGPADQPLHGVPEGGAAAHGDPFGGQRAARDPPAVARLRRPGSRRARTTSSRKTSLNIGAAGDLAQRPDVDARAGHVHQEVA